MFFAFAEISRWRRVYMPEEDEIDFRLAMRRASTGKLFARLLHGSTGGGKAIGRLKNPKAPESSSPGRPFRYARARPFLSSSISPAVAAAVPHPTCS